MPSYQDSGYIGQVIYSMLTESQQQTYYGDGWVLCDGRSVSGSVYAAITGSSTIPDARGRYLRAKDNAAGVDPNGDDALGTLRSDQNKAHSHAHTATHTHVLNYGHEDPGNSAPFGMVPLTSILGTTTTGASAPGSTDSSGGGDVQPLSVVMNAFIKIN